MSKAAASKSNVERRKSRRRPVLATFSLFCVVPSKGMHRLQIHDVSDQGIGFDLDTEGEELGDFKIKSGESLNIHLYLNQSLYLPLAVRVARIEESNQVRRVGAELDSKGPKEGHEAFIAFLKMLDVITDVAQIQSM